MLHWMLLKKYCWDLEPKNLHLHNFGLCSFGAAAFREIRSQMMSLYAYPHAAYHSLPPRLPDPMRTRMPPDAGTGWHQGTGGSKFKMETMRHDIRVIAYCSTTCLELTLFYHMNMINKYRCQHNTMGKYGKG